MKVAVLGMGKMGHALALKLLQSRNQIWIWNRTERPFSELVDAGAHVLASPSQCWDHADMIVTFVSDDTALRSVYLGPKGVLANPAKGIAVDMSTVSPEVSSEIASLAKERGIDFLRSPVSGNPHALVAGNLTIMVSGPRSAFEKAEGLLNAAGAKVLFLGEAEEARIAKLAVNTVLAATAEAIAEVIVLGECNGINRSTILNVIANSSLGSPFVAAKTPGLVNRNYEATFTSAMLLKDLRLALDAASTAHLTLPLTALASELLDKTCQAGFAELDFAALLPRLQEEVGQTPDLPTAHS